MSHGSRRAPRRLTQGEIELWTVVTADVRPMRIRPAAPPPPEAAPPAMKISPPPPVSPPSAKFVPSPPPPPPARVGDLDHRTRAKIKRGRLDVDVKLDLHGMRQDEAQRALNGFLRRAQASGAKVAIVVTGKGLSREDGGVLRLLARRRAITAAKARFMCGYVARIVCAANHDPERFPPK